MISKKHPYETVEFLAVYTLHIYISGMHDQTIEQHTYKKYGIWKEKKSTTLNSFETRKKNHNN